jgi:hypothetical protein
MNNRKLKLIILFLGITICSLGIIVYFLNSSYVARTFNEKIETKGRTILKERIFDLRNKTDRNNNNNIMLKKLEELDINSVEGMIIDIDTKFKINDMEIKINKALYIKEINELHFGVEIKDSNKNIDVEDIEFYLKLEENDIIKSRTLYNKKGIFYTFQECWFNIDLKNVKKLFFVTKIEKKEMDVLIYENVN